MRARDVVGAIVVGLVVLAINAAILFGAVWGVVEILQWQGVIE